MNYQKWELLNDFNNDYEDNLQQDSIELIKSNADSLMDRATTKTDYGSAIDLYNQILQILEKGSSNSNPASTVDKNMKNSCNLNIVCGLIKLEDFKQAVKLLDAILDHHVLDMKDLLRVNYFRAFSHYNLYISSSKYNYIQESRKDIDLLLKNIDIISFSDFINGAELLQYQALAIKVYSILLQANQQAGMILLQQNEFSSALTHFQNCISQYIDKHHNSYINANDLLQLYIGKIKALEGLGEIEQVIVVYMDAAKLNIHILKKAQILVKAAVLQFKSNRIAAAESSYLLAINILQNDNNKHLEKTPEDVDVDMASVQQQLDTVLAISRMGLGSCLATMCKYDNAVQTLTSVLSGHERFLPLPFLPLNDEPVPVLVSSTESIGVNKVCNQRLSEDSDNDKEQGVEGESLYRRCGTSTSTSHKKVTATNSNANSNTTRSTIVIHILNAYRTLIMCYESSTKTISMSMFSEALNTVDAALCLMYRLDKVGYQQYLSKSQYLSIRAGFCRKKGHILQGLVSQSESMSQSMSQSQCNYSVDDIERSFAAAAADYISLHEYESCIDISIDIAELLSKTANTLISVTDLKTATIITLPDSMEYDGLGYETPRLKAMKAWRVVSHRILQYNDTTTTVNTNISTNINTNTNTGGVIPSALLSRDDNSNNCLHLQLRTLVRASVHAAFSAESLTDVQDVLQSGRIHVEALLRSLYMYDMTGLDTNESKAAMAMGTETHTETDDMEDDMWWCATYFSLSSESYLRMGRFQYSVEDADSAIAIFQKLSLSLSMSNHYSEQRIRHVKGLQAVAYRCMGDVNASERILSEIQRLLGKRHTVEDGNEELKQIRKKVELVNKLTSSSSSEKIKLSPSLQNIANISSKRPHFMSRNRIVMLSVIVLIMSICALSISNMCYG